MKPSRRLQAVLLLASSIMILVGVVAYSQSLYKLVALFDETRQGRYLVLALYTPPLILVYSLVLSSMLAITPFAKNARLHRCIGGLLAYSTAPVLAIALLGILIGAPIQDPGYLAARLFVADTGYLSIVYSLSLIAWFLWILPSSLVALLKCPKTGASGRLVYTYARRLWGTIIARWLLSLLVAGLVALALRVILINLGVGVHYIVAARTSDWTLNKLLDTYIPRTVSLLVAPVWVIVLVYTYARLIISYTKGLSKQ